ncbi:NnrS protein involved in response to NO [Hyphomicrobiales bacterium]|nr:NnrS protein involved in response to NO [Hyphomicrobiales bacterium]CAH1701437.1 NnrS protein involved in response to NO [Hyphomicrobiales bacterium]CAI0345395.1 Short-chain dehydrogenase [Hyphomicrobiales bacterium]
MAPIPRLRAYDGPAILSYGFRPFFLLAALQAGLTLLVWLPFVTGHLAVPTAFVPMDWHVHEMLFGYQAAAIGGFLLTAIPNWTGRLPVQGKPLLVLVLAWLAGRLAVSASALIGWRLAMGIDALFLLLLAGAAAREIVAGRNWRNLKVVVLVGLLLAANLAFHLEAGLTGSADFARRLAIAVVLMLVMLIAGRIVPSFTRNWLAQRGKGRMPVPFGLYDKAVLAGSGLALGLWVAKPDVFATAAALAILAVLHLVRLARWAGERCWRNPLLIILHIAYLFVPLGFSLTALASFGLIAPGAGIHAWTAGAFGTMTLAVMSRASLGHTGRPLVATAATQACYVLVVLGSLARIYSALGHGPAALLHVAGLSWSLAFIVFALAYSPALTRARLGGKVVPNPGAA